MTEEQLQRKRAYMREYNQRPEVRERRRNYMREYMRRPEVREKQYEYNKIWRNRPENIGKVRKKQTDYKRRRYAADPEYRETCQMRSRAWYHRHRAKNAE